MSVHDQPVDVLIVGYGPVGQVLAAMLGRRGHRVRVVERHTALYRVSRAGTLDHEAMRVLQAVGVADLIEDDLARMASMELVDAGRQPIVTMSTPPNSPSGWHTSYTMYQPVLEVALDAAVRSLPTVDVVTGWEVDAVEEVADGVAVTSRHRDTGDTRTDRARFVIGADGANSLVRERCGIACDDLGYRGDWLVCDFEHHDPAVDLPFTGGFVLDPARPLLFGRWLGRRHSRFEFMVGPGEDPTDFDDPDVCWELVRPFGVTPGTSRLVRHAVYAFGSRLAQRWRAGRVLLAGDAAHVMPPFLGQGLCSGLRDAANLTWKLDLVLRHEATTDLLDSYPAERRPHVEQVILLSMTLGAMISLTDPVQAAGRDAFMRSQPASPPPPLPALAAGILHRPAGDDDGARADAVGRLSRQSQVRLRGHRGRLDDVVGNGWRILTRRLPAATALSAAQESLLKRLDARIVPISPAVIPEFAQDIDLDYETWFDELGVDAVVVRPDFYTYATLRSIDELGGVLDHLAAQLELT